MRLLVIEDDRTIASFLVKGLQEAGFAVDHAEDGRKGLALAVTEPYDAAVVDVMLPGLDGLSLIEEVRRRRVRTPVLILSARHTVDDRVRGLQAGGDDYLVKPFAFEELLARVRALTRRAYGAKGPDLEIGDLRIETPAQRVWRGKEEVHLTPREYALLEYLALRAGEVVSRTDIWEHVYDFNSEADSNVVDVYIGYLRKKIERPGRGPLIHTVRGRGYRLESPP